MANGMRTTKYFSERFGNTVLGVFISVCLGPAVKGFVGQIHWCVLAPRSYVELSILCL